MRIGSFTKKNTNYEITREKKKIENRKFREKLEIQDVIKKHSIKDNQIKKARKNTIQSHMAGIHYLEKIVQLFENN